MPASSHLCRHHNVEQCPRTPPASSARWNKDTTQRFVDVDQNTKLASSMRPLPGASHEAYLQLRLRHGLIALPLWRLEELISGLRCLACFATPCLRLGAEAAHGLPDCGAVDGAQRSVQPVDVPLICKSVLHTHCRLHTIRDQRQAALPRSTCVGNLGCVCASSAGACDGSALAQAPQHVCTRSMMTFTSSDNRVWKVRDTRKCLEGWNFKISWEGDFLHVPNVEHRCAGAHLHTPTARNAHQLCECCVSQHYRPTAI